MTEALQLMLWTAFRTLRLHRVEADIQAGNRASIAPVAILATLGFRLLLAPASLPAQGPASPRLPPPETAHAVAASIYPPPRGARTPSPLAAEGAAIRAAARRSYWLEGAVAGGLVFGAAGAVMAGGFCGADDRAGGAAYGGCTDEIIGGGLLGAALGGVLGGLVGSRIHKHEPRSHR